MFANAKPKALAFECPSILAWLASQSVNRREFDEQQSATPSATKRLATEPECWFLPMHEEWTFILLSIGSLHCHFKGH